MRKFDIFKEVLYFFMNQGHMKYPPVRFRYALLICCTLIFLITLTSFKHPALEVASLVGAWGYNSPGSRTVMIVTPGIFSVATYSAIEKKLLSSFGGSWRSDHSKIIKTIEWNSVDSLQVGNTVNESLQIKNNQLSLGNSSQTWTRLDDGRPGQLMGAWIITGNYRNDTVSKRPNPFFPRRTMKILSGSYFHWIAYNVKSKSFLNAGGGSYTTNNGKYSETIEFFTKTSQSVGKKLTFDFSFVNGDWRHKGEKSTGGPLDECWSRRETLESNAK